VSRRDSHNRLSYKGHFSVDADCRIVTDCHVTTGARSEVTVLPDRLAYQCGRLGLPVEEAIAGMEAAQPTTFYEESISATTFRCMAQILARANSLACLAGGHQCLKNSRFGDLPVIDRCSIDGFFDRP
jgi:hypothetical protein